MNLKEIFTMQEKLDDAIHKAHGVTPEEISSRRVCALLVEIGEFANEIAPFKYWKKNITINRDDVVEEFVDGIHFLTSLAIFVKMDSEIEPITISENQTEQLNEIFITSSHLAVELNKDTVLKAYATYLGMMKLIGVSEEELLSFYVNKNKVNFERIANNY